ISTLRSLILRGEPRPAALGSPAMDRSRTTLLALLLALLVPAPAAVAQAPEQPPSLQNPIAPENAGAPPGRRVGEGGNAGNHVVNGTDGGAGSDVIVDTQHGGHVEGGAGNDDIDVRNGKPGGTVTCGTGRDFVVADPGDRVGPDCEENTAREPDLVRRDAKN